VTLLPDVLSEHVSKGFVCEEFYDDKDVTTMDMNLDGNIWPLTATSDVLGREKTHCFHFCKDF
jgi:hypothetical protein